MAVAETRLLDKSAPIPPLWSAAFGVSALLLLVPFVFPLDGRPHANWENFLGRFHPLAVHLPIGFLVLLPILEGAARFRPGLREAAEFVLALSVVSCIGALLLGYLLAYGSGAAGAGVTRHMWGGIALTIGVIVCALLRPNWADGSTSFVYPASLACLLLLLSWTAHQGGSITHGENYLFEYLPPAAKRFFRLETVSAKTTAAPDSFYAVHIHPMLDANCVACHGESKVKGGLRLDSYEFVMKGGQAGPAIVPGSAEKSLLFERVTLSPEHKKFMPADGKTPLTPRDIAWLRAWIDQGASPSATTLAGVVAPAPHRDEAVPQVGDYTSLRAEMARLETSEGVKLVQVSSNPGDGLILNTIDASTHFTDAQLLPFEKFAPYIVDAELGRSGVTDASFDTLGKFTHLRSLHLQDTAVTGLGIERLQTLSQLTYLNLSGTKVTPAVIAPLQAMKNLQHLYLYNTPAQPAAGSTAQASPGKDRP